MNSTGTPLVAEDFRLPSGYKLKSLKVEKQTSSGGWSSDDGQLKAWVGEKKVSEGDGPVSFSTLFLEVKQFTGSPYHLELDLYGKDATGASVEYHKQITYPHGTMPVNPCLPLGEFLDRLDMTVTYTLDGLQAAVGPSGLSIDRVYFHASQLTDAYSPDIYIVDFAFDGI